MDLLEKRGKEIVVALAGCRLRPRRERPAKGGGDPGLIGQIFNLDNSTIH